ncbi:MAG: BrnT family toxin [Ignavibacteriales bacterium]|nr:BrnT family toxin [Ignavibacteriales bacterium]MCF8438533.1 BrnT family toxin [Ignavibacteriales bacterium]
MKYFDWNDEKNENLKKGRNLSFEKIVSQIESGYLLDIIEQPNKDKYKNQLIYVVEYESYAYLVPFIEDAEKVFLKTIIPSRKATKKYLNTEKK